MTINHKTQFYKHYLNNIFPNILYLSGDNFKNLKINDIRELKSTILKSTISKNERFIILDDIELFNINSLNALLKIVEEPLSKNYFILINNKTKPLIKTIYSRSLEIKILLKNETRIKIIKALITKSNLQVFIYDSLPPNLRCTIPGCYIPYYHTNEAHHCPKCEVRTNHSRQNCPIKAIDLNRYPDIYTKLNSYDNVYFSQYAGMGCTEYIRKKSGGIEMLFMHSDSWGQYGENTSDVDKLNSFIQNYKKIN